MSVSAIQTDPVTARYAGALFSLARKKGELDRVQEDVKRIDGELSHANVAAYLFDARVDMDKRRAAMKPLLDELSPLTRNFVGLLFDKRREEVLRGLGFAFHRRTMAEGGRAEGVVQSARPLDDALLERMAGSLGKKLGKTVTLTNELAPELGGGVRVTVENRMIDYSVQGRLDGIKRQMMEAALPSPQG